MLSPYFVLLILPFCMAITELTLTIQPKDLSSPPETRILTYPSFPARADSTFSTFLIFWDKDPVQCDQQAYINIGSSGELLKNGRYTDIVGSDSPSRASSLLSFYYTEPDGLRYHCYDDLQSGFFEITDISYNRDGLISRIKFDFEIHCLINGNPEQRAAVGKMAYEEADFGGGFLA